MLQRLGVWFYFCVWTVIFLHEMWKKLLRVKKLTDQNVLLLKKRGGAQAFQLNIANIVSHKTRQVSGQNIEDVWTVVNKCSFWSIVSFIQEAQRWLWGILLASQTHCSEFGSNSWQLRQVSNCMALGGLKTNEWIWWAETKRSSL